METSANHQHHRITLRGLAVNPADEVDARDVLPEPRLLPGDLVTWRGVRCTVVRVGWANGEPSPYHADPTLRAYVVPLRRAGWTDWAPVSTLLGFTEGDTWMDEQEAWRATVRPQW